MKIEIRKARKDYKCDYSGAHIKVGTKYKRVNVYGVGVFHFALSISDKKVQIAINSKCFDRFLDDLSGECVLSRYDNDINY